MRLLEKLKVQKPMNKSQMAEIIMYIFYAVKEVVNSFTSIYAIRGCSKCQLQFSVVVSMLPSWVGATHAGISC